MSTSSFISRCNCQVISATAALLFYCVGAGLHAADWPKFLGPTSDSKSAEKGLIAPWPKNGPEIVWARKLTESYSIGSVAEGRYYQFDHNNGKTVLYCLEATTAIAGSEPDFTAAAGLLTLPVGAGDNSQWLTRRSSSTSRSCKLLPWAATIFE